MLLVGDDSLLDVDLNLLKLENMVFYHNADCLGQCLCYNVYG